MKVPTKRVFVGLGHKARNGKGVVADVVAEDLRRRAPGARPAVLAFADDLKALARALGMQGKNGPMLQHLGLAMRALDPDYWINALRERLDTDHPDANVVLIPDVRFPNEADWILSLGGSVVKVTRLNEDGSVFIADDRDSRHISETALEEFDGWTSHIVARSVESLAALARETLAWHIARRFV